MASDIIQSIVINGVEYAPEGGCYINIDGDEVTLDGRFRPKREQTGWSCVECGARCLMRCVFTSRPTKCMFRDLTPDWQPFYGKVVE